MIVERVIDKIKEIRNPKEQEMEELTLDHLVTSLEHIKYQLFLMSAEFNCKEGGNYKYYLNKENIKKHEPTLRKHLAHGDRIIAGIIVDPNILLDEELMADLKPEDFKHYLLVENLSDKY